MKNLLADRSIIKINELDLERVTGGMGNFEWVVFKGAFWEYLNPIKRWDGYKPVEGVVMEDTAAAIVVDLFFIAVGCGIMYGAIKRRDVVNWLGRKVKSNGSTEKAKK